jgi:Imelysin
MRVLSILLAGALALGISSCAQAPAAAPTATQAPTAAPAADLSGMKRYLLDQTGSLTAATSELKAASDRYYALVEGAGFDYAALWRGQRDAVVAEIEAARAAWVLASPSYEKMEGIVAGTPSLAQFDVDLDAGTSAAEDPEGAVSFDLRLPDGRVLPKPGNLFGVTERALWGTEPAFVAGGVASDWDGDGAVGFGEALPDAHVLKGSADLLASMAGELQGAAQAWAPTESDAFTALVVMVPTMSEYFGSWKESRFVAGEASTQGDFVAISRLSDIQDILGGLEIVYAQVRPRAEGADPAQAAQIAENLGSLRAFVADVYAQERGGRRFTPEEADTLGAEAQNRATAITGQISQIAAALGVTIAE